jgi:hypothetical protein
MLPIAIFIVIHAQQISLLNWIFQPLLCCCIQLFIFFFIDFQCARVQSIYELHSAIESYEVVLILPCELRLDPEQTYKFQIALKMSALVLGQVEETLNYSR